MNSQNRNKIYRDNRVNVNNKNKGKKKSHFQNWSIFIWCVHSSNRQAYDKNCSNYSRELLNISCATNILQLLFLFQFDCRASKIYIVFCRLFVNWLTINRRYNNRISSSGGIDSTLHVKLYTSSEPLNVGEMNSAGPGRPEISMYFFVRPSALSATQLLFFVPR